MSGPPDAVYMLHWPGWESEAVSNRWHYARRWLREVPVVMVVPDRYPDEDAFARPDGRIDGLEVLHVARASARPEGLLRRSSYQAASILAHQRECGHRRVLTWQYNPYLAVTSALLPAVRRVYHATENYPDMAEDLGRLIDDPATLVALSLVSVEVADTVICCSSGVRAGLATRSGRADLLVVPNGCDLADYERRREPSAGLREGLAALPGDTRLAVYAGNINTRMDFDLMLRLAEEPGMAFAYAGSVNLRDLSAEQLSAWQALQALPHVIHLGPLPIHDVAALYHRADIGFIPYLRQPYLVRNGFPLKALEMAATGLPVVSTEMQPLRDVAPAVTVTSTEQAFLSAFRSLSRTTGPDAEAVAAVCAAHDYDVLFARAREAALSAVVDVPVPASLEPAYRRLGASVVLAEASRQVRWSDTWSEGGSLGPTAAVLAGPRALRRPVLGFLSRLRRWLGIRR